MKQNNYGRIIPVRLRKEHADLLEEASSKDHTCNGKISTFMRNAALDKAKKVTKK